VEHDLNSESFKAGLKRWIRDVNKQNKGRHSKYDSAADIKALFLEIGGGIAALIGVLLIEYSVAAVVSEIIDHPVKWSIVGMVILYFVSICRPARPRC